MSPFRWLSSHGVECKTQDQLMVMRRLMRSQKNRVLKARCENMSSWARRSFSFDRTGLAIMITWQIPKASLRAADALAGRLLQRWSKTGLVHYGSGNIWYVHERMELLLAAHGVRLDELEAITG